MTNENEVARKDLVNLIVAQPGCVKDMAVNVDGRVVAGLLADRTLWITFDYRIGDQAEVMYIEKPVAQFALRPRAKEIAVLRETQHLIERFIIGTDEKPHKIGFSNPTAVNYNEDGMLLAAGNAYGKVFVWKLEEDGTARAIVESSVGNERIVRVHFGFHCLIVLTERGKCYRVPFHFVMIPKVLVTSRAEPRLVAGDGKPYDWNCYAYAHHPKLSLEAFGGEAALLISQHDVMGLCGVKQTGLGRFIHKLEFCRQTGKLVALGEFGVQIWSVHTTVLHEKWQVAGDLQKLGRAAAAVKLLEDSYTAPEVGLKPLAYTIVEATPVVYWG